MKSGKCPHCGAKPRTRALVHVFEKLKVAGHWPVQNILEIGPSKVNALKLMSTEQIGGASYLAIDLRAAKFHNELTGARSFQAMDATQMDLASQSFDVCLCNHVLPFIKEDRKVLGEIFRILRPGGWAILNVPLINGATLTAAQVREQNPALTEDFYTENGTQWYYGEDYLERLNSVGFSARLVRPFLNHSDEELHLNGWRRSEEIILVAAAAPLLKTLVEAL